MAEYESIERPVGAHCLCTTHGELTSIDRDAETGTVETDDWGSIEADFHYHCEGMETVAGGHAAFKEGDIVVVTAMIEEQYNTPNWPKITGFPHGPKPCGRPGVHLSGGYISGENGRNWRPNWWNCENIDKLFGDFPNDDFTLVRAAQNDPQFWNYNSAAGGYYTEAVIGATTLVPDLESDEWEYLRGPIIYYLGSLDGIAITENCRLELYCGANYTNLLISLAGPGVWYTDGWNQDGWTVTGLPRFNLADYPEECIARHWTAEAGAAMGPPQALPHESNGYVWGSGSAYEGSTRPSTPPIRSLKIIDTRAA